MNRIQLKPLALMLPLLLFVADISIHPAFFSSHRETENIVAAVLVENKIVRLGTLNGHTVFVAFDKIDNGNNSARGRGNSGLVISAFLASDASQIGLSTLGRLTVERITESSPMEGTRLSELLQHASAMSLGSVLPIALNLPDKPARFPYQNVFMVIMPSDLADNEGLLERELNQIMEQAETLKLDSLVIPVLGYSWSNQISTKFDAFFTSALKSLHGKEHPRDVIFNFYYDWPTFVVENAVRSFNYAWHNASPHQPKLYRYPLRLILLTTFFCLYGVFIWQKRQFNLPRYLAVSSVYISCCFAVSEALKLSFAADGIAHSVLLTLCLCLLTVFFMPIVTYLQTGFFKGRS